MATLCLGVFDQAATTNLELAAVGRVNLLVVHTDKTRSLNEKVHRGFHHSINHRLCLGGLFDHFDDLFYFML
jgi:hypothetical protein